MKLQCPYCTQPATYRGNSRHLYSRNYGPVWECVPCKAWVGCHKGTRTPLGRLANAELRKAKMAAHAAFDPMWKSGDMKRRAAYAWLADALSLPPEQAHIGMMDVAMCRRVMQAVDMQHAGEPA